MEKCGQRGLRQDHSSSLPDSVGGSGIPGAFGVHNGTRDSTSGVNGFSETANDSSKSEFQTGVQNGGSVSEISNDLKMSSVEMMRAYVMSQILKDVEQGVNGMLAFSNSVPGFTDLHKDDKAALLKSKRSVCDLAVLFVMILFVSLCTITTCKLQHSPVKLVNKFPILIFFFVQIRVSTFAFLIVVIKVISLFVWC